jgi:ATP-dependent protease ClpP protease subunit
MMNWYSINNSIENKLSIAIDEEIGSFGIDAKSFIDEVKSSGYKEIELTVNSGGGSVFDALAIYDFLKNSTFSVNVKIEGLAASAATIIALSGDKLPVMTENSFFMIHNAWMPVVSMSGMNSDEIREYTEELEKQAELMDKINLKLAKIYSNATGLELSKVQSMMDDETWLTAEEAKEYNFISEIEGALAIAAYASPKELAKKGYEKVPSNYVNQLNNVNMSENKEGLLDQLKAYVADLLAPKAEAVEEVEETVEETQEVEATVEATEEVSEEVTEDVTEQPNDSVDMEAIKAELMAEIKAEVSAKEEAHASELAELRKELDKAKASRKPLEAKEDVSNPEAKVEEVDELGAAILNILKSSYKA